jgi:ankyrin repeat protein
MGNAWCCDVEPYKSSRVRCAAFEGNRGELQIFARRGWVANANDGPSGTSCLHHANAPEEIDLLLEFGANLEARDERGRTPLAYALDRIANAWSVDRTRLLVVVSALLKRGANVRSCYLYKPCHALRGDRNGDVLATLYRARIIPALLSASRNKKKRSPLGLLPKELIFLVGETLIG